MPTPHPGLYLAAAALAATAAAAAAAPGSEALGGGSLASGRCPCIEPSCPPPAPGTAPDTGTAATPLLIYNRIGKCASTTMINLLTKHAKDQARAPGSSGKAPYTVHLCGSRLHKWTTTAQPSRRVAGFEAGRQDLAATAASAAAARVPAVYINHVFWPNVTALKVCMCSTNTSVMHPARSADRHARAEVGVAMMRFGGFPDRSRARCTAAPHYPSSPCLQGSTRSNANVDCATVLRWATR